jgi:hypothetical protein
MLAVALAGCNKPAPEAEGTDAAAPAASEAAAPQAAATLRPGTYDVSSPDGKALGVTTIHADGTYTDDDAKGGRTAGIVRIVDGKTCFDPSGDAPEECYTETPPGADGSFTATNAKGETVNVKPQAK